MAVDATVAVRGEAVREADPELAQFSVIVHARDKDRAAALSRLAERVEALRAVLDRYAAAIEKRETSGLSVYAQTQDKSEKVVAYAGSATTRVTVHDLPAVGEIMLAVAAVDHADVHGPVWSLRPGSPVYREARRAAIAEAISRARDYADALGSRITGLVEISDTGLDGGMRPRAASLGFRPGAGTEPELDLDPQRQEVHAQIEGRFRISPPTVLDEPLD